MKKKILSLLFIFLFVLGLSSCKKHPSYKNLDKIQVEENFDYVLFTENKIINGDFKISYLKIIGMNSTFSINGYSINNSVDSLEIHPIDNYIYISFKVFDIAKDKTYFFIVKYDPNNNEIEFKKFDFDIDVNYTKYLFMGDCYIIEGTINDSNGVHKEYVSYRIDLNFNYERFLICDELNEVKDGRYCKYVKRCYNDDYVVYVNQEYPDNALKYFIMTHDKYSEVIFTGTLREAYYGKDIIDHYYVEYDAPNYPYKNLKYIYDLENLSEIYYVAPYSYEKSIDPEISNLINQLEEKLNQNNDEEDELIETSLIEEKSEVFKDLKVAYIDNAIFYDKHYVRNYNGNEFLVLSSYYEKRITNIFNQEKVIHTDYEPRYIFFVDKLNDDIKYIGYAKENIEYIYVK